MLGLLQNVKHKFFLFYFLLTIFENIFFIWLFFFALILDLGTVEERN